MSARSDSRAFLPLSNLAFQVLVALAEEDRHGYAIIKDIEQRTQGGLTVRSGALYTVLQRLLESGLVSQADAPEPEGDARRKYYHLTDLGREVAAAEGLRLGEMLEAARRRRLVPSRGTGA